MKTNAHKEVINQQPSTLIIGYGWVGQFIHKYFTEADWVDENNLIHFSAEQRNEWELAFICVPTPACPDGRCQMDYVKSAVDTWKDKVQYFCCKSTVEIGSCDYFNKKGINFCMSPEYLGETLAHPLNEPRKDTFVILGGPKAVTKIFAESWTLVTNSMTKIYQTDCKTAELTKLMGNSFIATKVIFVNEFFSLAEEIGVDFNELRELWLADPRVSRSHTYCYRNNRGFGGKCLPKDLNNLVWYFKNKTKIRAKLIEFLLEYNKEFK